MLFPGVIICAGIFNSITFGLNMEPNSLSASIHLTRISYAHGTSYGCSGKFFRYHCWKYCDGHSGNWCYTVYDEGRMCHDDIDCHHTAACQGWCAWNSQRGCTKSCHEVVQTEEPQNPNCRRGLPYWQCQSDYGNGWRSHIAKEGKWISADIPNEKILNKTGNTLTFIGNVATSTRGTVGIPQSALWYPTGPIQATYTSFYWTFTIRQRGTSSTSSISVGITDLKKVEPGWGVKGLFYDGNLSDGSGLLIGKFGSKLKDGDKFSMLIKFVDKRMKVYIILNDQPLGLAFNVPENTLDGIYPVVKFNAEGSVQIEERDSSDAPSQLEPVTPLSLEGNWTLSALGNKVYFGTNVTMKITEIYDRVYDKAYRIRINIRNKFMGNLIVKSTSNWVGEIIDKTTVEESGEEIELENQVAMHISGIKNVMLDTVKGELRLVSKDSTSLWKQIEPKLSFVNWNPFSKTKN